MEHTSYFSENWLNKIIPTLNSLIAYLTEINNGQIVYEQNEFIHPRTGRRIYAMSNGMTYSINEYGAWYEL